MKTIELKIKELSHNNIKDYGTVISALDEEPAASREELDAWRIEELLPKESTIQISWLELKKQRPFLLTKMDCHTNFSEAYIPMEGQSIIATALNKKDKDGKNIPDIDSLSAFYVDGSKGLCLKPLIWHWIPFPISQSAKFAIFLMKDRKDKDTEIIDLGAEYGVQVKFVLE